VERTLALLGTKTIGVFAGPAEMLNMTLGAAAHTADLIGSDLVTLDEKAAEFRILQNGVDVTAAIPHRLLYAVDRFDTDLVCWPPSAIDVEIMVANAPTPMVRDSVNGGTRPPERLERLGQQNRLRLQVPGADHLLVIDFNFGNASATGAAVDVRREALPHVDEIIFRYQQTQAAQDAALRNFVAHARIEQHFHPSPVDPPYNVITENRLFFERGTVEWEELSFEFNGAKWTSDRPPFPLVQPEKVLSVPLDLRLDQDYTYRLDGVDTIGGRAAFVVRFDPLPSKRSLYRGTVWIDRQTFVRLKVQAVETQLTGAIVSDDETQMFESQGAVEGRPVWLLTRLVSKQIFLIGGRSVLVEREMHLTDVALNPATFEQERREARASNRIMYRDTDQGVRYLVKSGETRIISDRVTASTRAFVAGTDVDPSFDRPLPLVGVDIVDFNFLNRNLQFVLLYGGVVAYGNLQRAHMLGGRFDASLDFSGIAVKANDDVFDAQGRRPGERVDRIPASVGINVGYGLTPFQKVTAHYELHYDAYFRDPTTAPNFVIPSNTATNVEGIGYEYRRRGYSFLTHDYWYQRATWTSWGYATELAESDKTYNRYDIGLSKDFTLRTFQTIHLNAHLLRRCASRSVQHVSIRPL
jgi:hypothetical protein